MPDGASYEGDYVEGKKHGMGKSPGQMVPHTLRQFIDNNIDGDGNPIYTPNNNYRCLLMV